MSDKEIFTREETSNLVQQARKQGALEELNKLNYYCDKAQVDERAIKRMILKRIKELEKEGV